jgi:AcrR family transcriptional regulator
MTTAESLAEAESAADPRERILTAAHDLLARDGPAAVGLRDVAAAAGCSTMMIYTLFGGKDGLLEAVYLDGFGRLHGALATVGESEPLARLRGLARAYRSFGLAHPALYAAMFSRPITASRLRGPGVRRETQSFATLQDAVERARAAGRFGDAMSANRLADVLWSAIHGHVALEVSGHLGDDRAASAARFEALLDLLLAGALGGAPGGFPAAAP